MTTFNITGSNVTINNFTPQTFSGAAPQASAFTSVRSKPVSVLPPETISTYHQYLPFHEYVPFSGQPFSTGNFPSSMGNGAPFPFDLSLATPAIVVATQQEPLPTKAKTPPLLNPEDIDEIANLTQYERDLAMVLDSLSSSNPTSPSGSPLDSVAESPAPVQKRTRNSDSESDSPTPVQKRSRKAEEPDSKASASASSSSQNKTKVLSARLFTRFYPKGTKVEYMGNVEEIDGLPKRGKIALKGYDELVSISDLKPILPADSLALVQDPIDPWKRYALATIDNKAADGTVTGSWLDFGKARLESIQTNDSNALSRIIPLAEKTKSAAVRKLNNLKPEWISWPLSDKETVSGRLYKL